MKSQFLQDIDRSSSFRMFDINLSEIAKSSDPWEEFYARCLNKGIRSPVAYLLRLFIPQGYQSTFAELEKDVKNKISHRAIALKKVIQYLNNT
jgi:hypothetical protein